MKSYTDIEQSKKLAEFLPLESADMYYSYYGNSKYNPTIAYKGQQWFLCQIRNSLHDDIPCWSLTALLKYLSEIKPRVYTPILFPSEGKWILQFVEYGHGNVCEIINDNPIDACTRMILKLQKIVQKNLLTSFN